MTHVAVATAAWKQEQLVTGLPTRRLRGNRSWAPAATSCGTCLAPCSPGSNDRCPPAATEALALPSLLHRGKWSRPAAALIGLQVVAPSGAVDGGAGRDK
jgi:hypothetical protein